jgi:hypothetical protein
LDFLHWANPEHTFDVVSLALENDLATPRIFAAILVVQHPMQAGKSPTANARQ